MGIIYGYTELIKDSEKLQKHFCIGQYGLSAQGRKLVLIKTGNGSRCLLAVGGIHGREAVSSLFLMKSLRAINPDSPVFKDVTLYVAPMANPDGVEIFWGREKPNNRDFHFVPELYKNNSNNVNLNANFPYIHACVPQNRQGGSFACSEPETRSLIKLCIHKNFNSMISLHARGNCIFWRDRGNGAVKGDLTLTDALCKNCGFTAVAPTESPSDYSGGFENWFRYRFKRPALCIELVRDEDVSYRDMCRCFEDSVIWSKTKNLLETFIITKI